MRQRILIFSLLLLSNWAVYAQFVFIPGQTFDFGTIENWQNNPATFSVVNAGTKNMAILKLSGSKNILAEYPKNYIAPGDTAHILIRIYTPHEGPFSENLELMLSSTPEPLKLTVKGKIKSFAGNALMACPSDNLQGSPATFNQQFLVVDETTQKPIPVAQITIDRFARQLDKFKIPQSGKPVKKTYLSGLYTLLIEADGYPVVDTGIVILAGERAFTFYLKKEDIPLISMDLPPPAPEVIPPPVAPPPDITRVPVADTVSGSTLLPEWKYKPNNIVFVLDVSSSMRILNRMDMLKTAMLKLTEELRPGDRISIITFTSKPEVHLSGVKGSEKETLRSLIESFQASGSTNGIKGLKKAYNLAETYFIAEGNNVVIIGTDGEFPQTDEEGNNVSSLIDGYSRKNIKLGVMAFGRDAEALKSMEKMAHLGSGGYMRMDNPELSPMLLLEQIQLLSERK